MDRILVKPVDGRICKDPITYVALPAEGRRVPKNAYWLRRLKDGDCALHTVAATKPKRARRKTKTEETN